jgi:hypothetical protein
MKDIVKQTTLVVFSDLLQTRTTNNVVFAAVENTISKIVKNSSEVMSRRDDAWWSCTDYEERLAQKKMGERIEFIGDRYSVGLL